VPLLINYFILFIYLFASNREELSSCRILKQCNTKHAWPMIDRKTKELQQPWPPMGAEAWPFKF
jgi:hypothetical protein